MASLRNRLLLWLRDYNNLQSSALILLYIQIGCAVLGSLGALYNGVLLMNLDIALFALVAIESGSQCLGRTYGILLIAATLLDIIWFIMFSHEIWHISSEDHGKNFILSVKLVFSMQIIAFSVRFISSFLWMRMYIMGAPNARSQEDMRTSFLKLVQEKDLDGKINQTEDLDARTSHVLSQETNPLLNATTSGITDPRTIQPKKPLGGPYEHPVHFPVDSQYLYEMGDTSEIIDENASKFSTGSLTSIKRGGTDESMSENMFTMSLGSNTTNKDFNALANDIEHALDLAGSTNIASTSSSAAEDQKESQGTPPDLL